MILGNTSSHASTTFWLVSASQQWGSLTTHKPRLPITPRILTYWWKCGLICLSLWMQKCCGKLVALGSLPSSGAGEFTYDPRFDKAPPLTVQDVAVDDRSSPSKMTVHLRRTKTDQFGRGVTLCVGRSYGESLLSGCCAQLSGCKIYKGRPTFHLCKWKPLSR